MRPTSASSTSPVSNHANKSSFLQSSLTLASPPTSINGEDTLPQLGFGWEFELTLEEHMRQKEHEIVARFQRYERFGMRLEEARLPTPDRFRTAYDELVEAINNDRTPSPSPEYVVGSNRNLRKVNVTQRHLRRKDTTEKVHNSFNCGDKSRISKQNQDKDDNALENGGFAKDMKATCTIILNFECIIGHSWAQAAYAAAALAFIPDLPCQANVVANEYNAGYRHMLGCLFLKKRMKGEEGAGSNEQSQPRSR